MRKIDDATKNELVKRVQEGLKPEIEKTVKDAVTNIVAEQVRDWHDMFVKCSDVAYSAEDKITAIWFYLKHPKGFLLRVDKQQEARPFQDGKWTFTKKLVCYLDYLYHGKINTVTLIEALGDDCDKYHSAQVYEETDKVFRVLICYRDKDGFFEEVRLEIEKSTGSFSSINDLKEEVKRYGEVDEKETRVWFEANDDRP